MIFIVKHIKLNYKMTTNDFNLKFKFYVNIITL